MKSKLTKLLAFLAFFFINAPVAQAFTKVCTINGQDGIETALGCIGTDLTGQYGLITVIIKLGVNLGGGFALVLILYGAFIITTSAGIPDKLKEGQEIITSAIIGLIFIVLSVVLLYFIGVNLLGIPGLS